MLLCDPRSSQRSDAGHNPCSAAAAAAAAALSEQDILMAEIAELKARQAANAAEDAEEKAKEEAKEEAAAAKKRVADSEA